MSQLGVPFDPSAITSSIDVVIGLYESSLGISLRALYISLFPITLCEGLVFFFVLNDTSGTKDMTTSRESFTITAAAVTGLFIGLTLFSFIRKAFISNYGGTYKRHGPGYHIDQYYREGPLLSNLEVNVLSIATAIAMILVCMMGCRFYLSHTISSPAISLLLSLVAGILTYGITQEAFSTPQFARVRVTKILFTLVIAILSSCLHPLHLLSMMKIDHDHVLATMIFWVQLILIGLEFNEEINVKRIESAQLRALTADDKMK
jgi:magnesium-transporting ATPase (P-type)